MAYNPYNPDEYLKSPTGAVTAPGTSTFKSPVASLVGGGGSVTGVQSEDGNPGDNLPPAGGHKGPGGEDPCPAGTTRVSQADGTSACLPNAAPNTDCPQGQTWDSVAGKCLSLCPDGQARNGQGDCVALNLGSGGSQNSGNSAGGGGGAAGVNTKVGVSPYDSQLQSMIMDYLTSIMQGKGLPFSPEVVDKLRAAAFQTAQGRAGAQQSALAGDLARAGLSRSGIAIDKGADIQRNAGAQFSQDSRTIAVTAVQENFKAKKEALQQAQDFLNSERANQLSQANLTLAYAQLNQQWKSLLASFDQQMAVIDKGNEQEITKLILCIQQGGTNCY